MCRRPEGCRVPVATACEIAEVSTSGFYDGLKREAAGPTARELADDVLVELIREGFDASDGNYGVPRMHRELRRAGLQINERRVRRLMRLHDLAGRCLRQRVQTTFPGADGYTIPDLAGRAFTPGRPGQAWCQYITYIATSEGRLCLASVVDIDSRWLLGNSMADHMRTELDTDALEAAITARDGHAAGVVIAHADRGSPSTRRTSTSSSADATSSAPRSGGLPPASTTPSPIRSWHHSSASASKAECSPHEPMPAVGSSAGSTGTTPPDCTSASTAPAPSTGNSSSLKRHNHRPPDREMHTSITSESTRRSGKQSVRQSAERPTPASSDEGGQ